MTDTAHLDHKRECELKEDVQHVVSELTDQERAVCQALSAGTSHCNIAASLGITRYQVDRIVTRIAEQFTNEGLDEWVRR
jgi:FixJ family two-component response regulator